MDSPNVTSSPVSVDGPRLLDSRIGQQIGLFGQDHVPANRFRWQGLEKAMKMKGIYGRSSVDSSLSHLLQLSLENRLRRQMDVNGSMEYDLTWKRWAMPSGPPICALRVSVRRTSGNAFGGWPTPCQQDGPHGGPNQGTDRLPGCAALTGWSTPSVNDSKNNAAPSQFEMNSQALNVQATIAGWPTCTVTDAIKGGKVSPRQGMMGLSETVQIAGYPTPSVPNGGRAPKGGMTSTGITPDGKKRQVDIQFIARGMNSNSSHASTESTGVLNPALSRWLMGFPAAWDSCGVTAMQSCRKSRRNS